MSPRLVRQRNQQQSTRRRQQRQALASKPRKPRVVSVSDVQLIQLLKRRSTATNFPSLAPYVRLLNRQRRPKPHCAACQTAYRNKQQDVVRLVQEAILRLDQESRDRLKRVLHISGPAQVRHMNRRTREVTIKTF